MKLKLICSIQTVEKYLRAATLSKLNQFYARQVCSALLIVNSFRNIIQHANNAIQKSANILINMAQARKHNSTKSTDCKATITVWLPNSRRN